MSGLILRDIAMSPGSTLKPLERWVAVVIASFMGRDSKAWPGYEAIAKRAGMSQSGVRKVLLRVCGPTGVLHRDPRPGGGFVYRLREGVPVGQCPGGTVSPEDVGVSPWDGGGVPVSMRINQESIKKRAQTHSEPSQGSQRETSQREPWLVQARNAWSEGVGEAPRWFDADLRKIVNGSRPGEAVLAGLRTYLKSADLQKPGADVLRAFTQNAARWCSPAKPKAPEPEVYRGTDEQRRAKALRYGIVLP